MTSRELGVSDPGVLLPNPVVFLTQSYPPVFTLAGNMTNLHFHSIGYVLLQFLPFVILNMRKRTDEESTGGYGQ